jgi:hypothetical protein
MNGMEKIEVVARFDSQGNVIPQQFTRQGSTYPVESIGRRWVTDTGQHQHILVMIPDGKVFELVFAPLEGRWYFNQSPDRGSLA